MASYPEFSEIETTLRRFMQAGDLHGQVQEEFLRRVKLVHEGASGKIPWESIAPLSQSDLIFLEKIEPPAPARSTEEAQRLVMIKLNGGLGTSMGLSKAKTLLPVKDGHSFLDIIREQCLALRKELDAPLPLLFMNSFNTQADTRATPGIKDINLSCPGQPPADFLQNRVPRILQESLLPVGPPESKATWCPPGHGDIFLALEITGTLDRLIEAGYTVAFISNGDNLGARPDFGILHLFLEEGLEWASEVTPKTPADLKGGVLFSSKDSGRIELLEIAQVPEEHSQDFQNIEVFPYFNINNLWVDLLALKKRLQGGGLPLALIVNPKEVEGKAVYQLETAMGAAVGHFEKSRVIVVPRSRFAPVKTTADLLVRRSDIYLLDPKTWDFSKNPNRSLGEPKIRLSPDYKKISDFENLFPSIPSLLELEELIIEGPVLFDRPVRLHGNVHLKNESSASRSISDFIGDRVELL